MANHKIGNFSADGESETFVANRVTLFAGNDTTRNFGSGALTVKAKQVDADGVDWSTIISITAASDDFQDTTVEYAGGLICKVELEGATSPSLPWTVKWD